MASPEERPYIDPNERLEKDTSVRPAERLGVVSDFLQRDDLKNLSPLETHIIEQALGRFLKDGEVGFYGSLSVDIHRDPPHRIYMDDDMQKDDVDRTLIELESKKFLSLDEKTGKYELITQRPTTEG